MQSKDGSEYIQMDISKRTVIEAKSLDHTRLVVTMGKKYYGGQHENGGAIWTESLAEAKVYTHMNAARSFVNKIDGAKSKQTWHTKKTKLNIKLLSKKDIMIARIKGNE